MSSEQNVLIIRTNDIKAIKVNSTTGCIKASYNRVVENIKFVILVDDNNNAVLGEVMCVNNVYEWAPFTLVKTLIKGCCSLYLNKFRNVSAQSVILDTDITTGNKIRYSSIDVSKL